MGKELKYWLFSKPPTSFEVKSAGESATKSNKTNDKTISG